MDRGSVKVVPCLDKEVIPLLPSSCHAAHVHPSWPYALMKRVSSLSACHEDFLVASHDLINKYVRCNAAESTIVYLAHAAQKFEMKFNVSAKPLEVLQSHVKTETKVWLSLGYHPALTSVLRKALKKSPCPRDILIDVGWRKSLPTLDRFLSVHNRSMLKHHRHGRLDGDDGGHLS